MIDSELLRHVDFIKSQGIAVGRRVPLDLSEQETNGEALILAVEPCPSIEAGIGEVVTGTFSHIADEILELRITGQTEPIGVTPEHPFWSIDRQDFVPVGELRIGETLRTVHGEQVAVESITPRGPPARVYNLEIDGTHQYHVSSLGLLVHNTCAKAVSTVEPKGGTYKLVDRDTGDVVRVGRTNNLLRREAEHTRHKVFGGYKFVVDRVTDVYAQQRGREQLIQDLYRPVLNKIRGISLRNPKIQEYLDAARELD